MTGRFGAFDLSVARGELSCIEVLTVIQSYADCECDVDTMMVLAAHIEVCGECGDQLMQLRWIKAAVRRCSRAPESSPWR
jgi:ribosomal protein L37AE/L43A